MKERVRERNPPTHPHKDVVGHTHTHFDVGTYLLHTPKAVVVHTHTLWGWYIPMISNEYYRNLLKLGPNKAPKRNI